MCMFGRELMTTKERTVLAWRSWENYGKFLTSLVYPARWKPGEVKTCKPPTTNSERGFYGFKKREQLSNYEIRGPIFGIVKFSGTIIHYKRGFRAERAEIVSLSDREVAERYGVKFCGSKLRRK